jgi:hypothetical protein
MRRLLLLTAFATLAGGAAHAVEGGAPASPAASPAGADLPLYINIFAAPAQKAVEVQKASAEDEQARMLQLYKTDPDQASAEGNGVALTRGASVDFSDQPPPVIRDMTPLAQKSCAKAGGVFKAEKPGKVSCG